MSSAHNRKEFEKQSDEFHRQLTRYRMAAKERAADLGQDISPELAKLRRAFNDIEAIINEAD